jgi:hypothetical protein
MYYNIALYSSFFFGTEGAEVLVLFSLPTENMQNMSKRQRYAKYAKYAIF